MAAGRNEHSLAKMDVGARHKEFARHIARGEPKERAAELSGFHPDYAKRLIHLPDVAMALRAEIVRRLTIIAPDALNVLHKLATDESVPASTRRAAASDLMDRAGFVAPKANIVQNGTETAQLSELSTDALRAMVDKLGAEIAERAKPILDASDGSSSKRIDPQPSSTLNNPLNALDD